VLLAALELGASQGFTSFAFFRAVDASRYGMVWYGLEEDLVGNFLRSGTDTFEVVSVSRSDWRLHVLSCERVLLLFFVSAIDLHNGFDRLARFCQIQNREVFLNMLVC
jgi:hypothetical protein